MIFVKYQGRLGNNIFQWAFARVLSKLAGAPMTNLPIQLFRHTANLNKFTIPKNIQSVLPAFSSYIDLGQWVRKAEQEDVLVHGYPHNTRYYQPHKEMLARELVPRRGGYANRKSVM